MKRNDMVFAITAGLGAVCVFVAIEIAFPIGRSPASFTARGGEQVCVNAPDIADGSQVTVTNSDGHVIATGTLSDDGSKAALAAIKAYDALQAPLSSFGLSDGTGMSVYKFSVTVPAGQDRYGISIGGPNRGTVWDTEDQMRHGPQLTLGC